MRRLALTILAVLPLLLASSAAGSEDRFDWTPGKIADKPAVSEGQSAYGAAYDRALREGMLFLVWVRHDRPLLVPGAVNHSCQEFRGETKKAVFVGVPGNGEIKCRGPLPPDATIKDILAEAAAVKAILDAPEEDAKTAVQPIGKKTVTAHSHRCPHCGKTFVHPDYNFGLVGPHMCPYCGHGPVWPIIARSTMEVQAATPAQRTAIVAKAKAYRMDCPH